MKTGDHSVQLLTLANICLRKKNSSYMGVVSVVMDREYRKAIKWKSHAALCKSIIRSLSSLDDIGEEEANEKDLQQMYKAYDSCFHGFTDILEKNRMMEKVSADFALLLQKAVLKMSKLHIYSMAHAHEKIVWKTESKEVLLSIIQCICDCVIESGEACEGIVAEKYPDFLRYTIRGAKNLNMEPEISVVLLSTLRECIGKPCKNDEDLPTFFFYIALAILTEFCSHVMGQPHVGSKFIPTLIEISVSEEEDDFSEQLVNVSKTLVSTLFVHPKTVAPHADKIIDSMLDSNLVEGILAIAWASYQSHPEKINPRLEKLVELEGDQSSQCYILQLLRLVAKNHPELWSDKLHNAALAGFKITNMTGLTFHCLCEAYSNDPARLLADLDTLMPILKREPLLIHLLYQVFPQVAAVNAEYAENILAAQDDLMATHLDIQTQSTLIMSYRSIASAHKSLVAKRRAIFEQKNKEPALSEKCRDLLDYLDDKILENVYQEVSTQRKDVIKLDERVGKAENKITMVTQEVDKHGRDINHTKEDVTKAEVKLDTLTDTVQEMGEKVEYIDHKTLDHAPAWSRSVSVLLNPESTHDWRLLAQRLGYSNKDIRGWGTQVDPCMALLNEWFATNKTSEAVHGVYQSLVEMNRIDAADILKKAMDDAGKITEDEPEDVGPPPPVFISYQWGHQSEVKLLKRHLEMAGYRAWMDIGQMGGGDKLFAKIDQGMRSAKVMICCVTDKYAKSDNCTREVNLAVTLGKPIIPLLMAKSKWPPEGAMGPIFGEYLFIRFWQRGAEVTSENDERYWPLVKFTELLMQICLYVAPEVQFLTDPYRDWCNPVDEDIKIENIAPPIIKDGKSQPQVRFGNAKASEASCPEVFISYQWGKQAQIRKLHSKLTDLGLSCWIDIQQMGGGDSLYEKIDKGIRGCKVVVSCCTKKYSLSANCRREVSLADALKKPIVAILLEEMSWPPEGAMSMVFTQLLYIDFSQDLNVQEIWTGPLFDQLIQMITEHIKPSSAISGHTSTAEIGPPNSNENDLSTGRNVTETEQIAQAYAIGENQAVYNTTAEGEVTAKTEPVEKEKPSRATDIVKNVGSEKYFDAQRKWRKVKNVKSAAAGFKAVNSQACAIL